MTQNPRSQINRFSSRRQRLDSAFLNEKLRNAKTYRRIAGYFRSSIFELVGEEIAGIESVKVICNSELDAADVVISKHVRETALKERWNEATPEVEALLHRDRYKKLYELLASGKVEIRVVPKDRVFLHGKAGVIEQRDGSKTCFLGSINETKSAFTNNYEILWEDTSLEGVSWVEEEFEALWNDGLPLPDAIISEVKRVAERVEITFADTKPFEVPEAALAETPIYRGGEQLQPWQRSFVSIFMRHRELYGKARLLLADEVGVGKTLSLAASAMISALLDEKPVLILCPSTLTFQWQVELKDKLGIPSAVWSSNKKVWIDQNEQIIKTRGAEDVARCPFKIGIVSTGLIFHDTKERVALKRMRFGTIVLDEAHKARRSGGVGPNANEPNNLLAFMLEIATKTENVLLGTATPIQTDVRELWDLLEILGQGAEFVLGREFASRWRNMDQVLPIIKGESHPTTESEAWDLIRCPLGPAAEHQVFANLRMELGLSDAQFFSDRGMGSLEPAERNVISQTLVDDFFRENNPMLRHTVLRRRQTLEEQGLLEKIAVNIHPSRDITPGTYAEVVFDGLGLNTNQCFDLAYQAAIAFTDLLKKRTKSAGFMKTLLLQRICSSFASGLKTAEKLLSHKEIDDDEIRESSIGILDSLTEDEVSQLKIIIAELGRKEAIDPKQHAVHSFLTKVQSDGQFWLHHGCIVFSQYYDTAYWIAEELGKVIPNEPVAVYAGVGKSGIFRNREFANISREEIKKAVKERTIRLVIATDAACEGLNLQTLGTLINIDLPWNPSRLEQRLGRIKRFGQARRSVDMLNLVYHETQDEVVYEVLSRRLKDKFDIFGGLPDTIEDEWIESAETLEEQMDRFIHLRKNAKDVFELRYKETIDPDANRWELCSRVLSRKDIQEKLSEAW
jgi:SNF2 family DNA or RNA helicase